MTKKTSSAKVAGYLGLLVLIVALSAGCTTNDAYEEARNNKIVSCSHFYKITDDYQTPEGRFIIIEKYGEYLVSEIGLDFPGKLSGKYASIFPGQCHLYNGCDLWNLTPLSENETGMRDACRVNPF